MLPLKSPQLPRRAGGTGAAGGLTRPLLPAASSWDPSAHASKHL